jgi:hypothetical protein
MGKIRQNKQYIVPGALISASYVSDLYDLVTGNTPEDVAITGSLNVTGSIYGRLIGTASWAESSSFALTASYALNGGGGTLDTSSFVKTSQTASMTVATASYIDPTFISASAAAAGFGASSGSSGSGSAAPAFPYTGSAGISGSLLVDGRASFGFGSVAVGIGSFANGLRAGATGSYSHAEGNRTQAASQYSHAEGDGTIASGNISHAEGQFTYAYGIGSHTEGAWSQAYGYYSHAEGWFSRTYGYASHAQGRGTITLDEYQHASGMYNIPMSGSGVVYIGNGTEFEPRNILVASGSTLQITGSLRVSGSVFVDLSSLPTADPHAAGQLWRSGNFIMVSLG